MPLTEASGAAWIAELGLQPHPEGGHYGETYRSREQISGDALPDRYGGNRSYATSIYFFLGPDDRSKLHRLQTDEVWHFHLGGRIELVVISPDGRCTRPVLGQDPAGGGRFQCVVPAGTWFGARPLDDHFVLVGCTMAPGFDFADFEMGDRMQLLTQFPQHQALIDALT